MGGNKTVLRVSHLGVDLDGVEILGDLNFDLSESETLVILGPNGAGKTVLLRALLGLLPHHGEVAWKEGVRVGYVPQRVPLNRDLPITVTDFFGLKGVSQEMTRTLLSEVGISNDDFSEETQLGLLSSGQFQRVLIAWALAKDPEVLIFDEPTAGVDIAGKDRIHDFLHESQARRNFAVILVTHDLTTVYGEATRVLCINRKKSCYGSPREILDPKVLQDVYGREIQFFRHTHG